MDQQEKIEILEERNKQTRLTYSFVNSIALGITGILLLSFLMGYFYFLNFSNDDLFRDNFVESWSDLHWLFILLIANSVLNLVGLIMFGKDKVIGWWMYAITSVFFAILFIVLGEMFGYFLSLCYIGFVVLLRIYGFKRIKEEKELNQFKN